MPQPTLPSSPTAEQLVIVSEITLLDYDTVATMVAADSSLDVSNAKWALTVADIAAWPAIKEETGDVKRVGTIEFFEAAASSPRLDFRNKVRARYNQPLLTTERPQQDTQVSLYGIASQEWF